LKQKKKERTLGEGFFVRKYRWRQKKFSIEESIRPESTSQRRGGVVRDETKSLKVFLVSSQEQKGFPSNKTSLKSQYLSNITWHKTMALDDFEGAENVGGAHVRETGNIGAATKLDRVHRKTGRGQKEITVLQNFRGLKGWVSNHLGQGIIKDGLQVRGIKTLYIYWKVVYKVKRIYEGR